MDVIANLELVELPPGGSPIPIRVQLGRPQPDEQNRWSCPVLVSTIDDTVRNIHGEDSMQVLCLAVQFCHTILKSVLDRGSRLLYPGEEIDFPLAAIFGRESNPSP